MKAFQNKTGTIKYIAANYIYKIVNIYNHTGKLKLSTIIL